MKKVHVNAATSSDIPYYVVHDENNICGFFGQFRWLSNFWACPKGILYEGIAFPSVEHAYQAAKIPKGTRVLLKATNQLVGRPDFVNITSGQVKKLGKKVPLPQNWNDIKLGIMTELVNIKFQDIDFRKMLFETGLKHLEERNSWHDLYWGTDETGKGENHLGKILMDIRMRI